MRKLALLAIVASIVAWSSLAHVARADDCKVVSMEQATAAVALLTNAVWRPYCTGCSNDTIETIANTVVAHPVSAQQGSVQIDGADVDLAITYVFTGADTFTNVARMVGCDAKARDGFITFSGHASAYVQDKLFENAHRFGPAREAIARAKTDAERAAANAHLEALQRRDTALRAELEAAKAEERRIRNMPRPKPNPHPSQGCLDNPLAPNCY